MTETQRGLLIGLVGGLVAVLGTSNHWPGLVITVLCVLAALLVIALTKTRPERPL